MSVAYLQEREKHHVRLISVTAILQNPWILKDGSKNSKIARSKGDEKPVFVPQIVKKIDRIFHAIALQH